MIVHIGPSTLLASVAPLEPHPAARTSAANWVPVHPWAFVNPLIQKGSVPQTEFFTLPTRN